MGVFAVFINHREVLSEKMTLDQRPEENQRASHSGIWGSTL